MATVTLLAEKELFWRYQGQLWTGTAASGSTSTLVDAGLIDLASDQFPFPVEGKQLRITSTITDLRRIPKVDKATGTLYPNRLFSSAISTNTYSIWGNSIDGGTPLTNLFNDVLQVARPLTQTQVTIVTGQEVYDITTLVTSPEDVVAVWVRSLDQASPALIPYTAERLWGWRVYPLISSSIQALKLLLPYSLTLDATQRELWVEHRKALTAFSTDASTVDATYQEWLAWEAVLRHAIAMKRGQADKGRWTELAKEAAAQVKQHRLRFMPPLPIKHEHADMQWT